MNKQIKFRAWNLDKGEWVNMFAEDVYIGMDEKETLVYGSGGYAFNAILQQFTGLKDRNGKDIYEGDIVVYESGNASDTAKYLHNGELVYENGAFGHIFTYDLIFVPLAQSVFFEDGVFQGKVIGNRFENPKLLES